MQYLGFEKPIEALAASAAALRRAGGSEADAAMLDERAERQLVDLYARLTPWQRTQVARHPDRPHFHHFVEGLFEEFLPLAGDRAFGDDKAIIGGLAKFEGRSVLVIGHVKGEDTTSRLHHNFGMARPEGYRKAIRLMDLADRFGLPVITLVDTPGAFPGIDAEARGQAEAIARSTERCLSLGVPLIAVIVGEGGSGGAVALAAANRVLMFEHAVYSVISPEGAAEVARRSRGTPRIAGRLLRRVRDFAHAAGHDLVDAHAADSALNRLEVDKLGLDAMDRRYLMMIADIYRGGPVGVETLAAGLSEPRDTVEEVIEPYLIQLGLIARTARGRCLNAGGWKHLGLNPPAGSQDGLFD